MSIGAAYPWSLLLVLPAMLLSGCGELRVYQQHAVNADQSAEGGASNAARVEGSEGKQTTISLSGAPDLQALLEPRLRAAGIAISDAQGAKHWQLSLEAVAPGSDALRVVHEQTVNDGGPRRIAREVYQGYPLLAHLRISGPQQAIISGQALPHPAPDQRRDHGRWLLGDGTVRVVRGPDAQVEQAAIDHAIELFISGYLQPVTADKANSASLSIALDSRDRSLRPILQRAAQGEHQTALNALRLRAEAAGDSLSAPLAYNIAVLLDISGEHQAALAWYGQALSLDPRDDYRQQLEACRQRAQNAPAAAGWL